MLKTNKFKKALVVGTMAVAILAGTGLSGNTTVEASSLKLTMDGVDVTTKAQPRLVNGRTMVPVRYVAEELGFEVKWTPERREKLGENDYRIHKPETHIIKDIGDGNVRYMQVRENSLNMYRTDRKSYDNNTGRRSLGEYKQFGGGKVINNTMYVPIRGLEAGMGMAISWDQATSTVKVDTTKTVPYTKTESEIHEAKMAELREINHQKENERIRQERERRNEEHRLWQIEENKRLQEEYRRVRDLYDRGLL